MCTNIIILDSTRLCKIIEFLIKILILPFPMINHYHDNNSSNEDHLISTKINYIMKFQNHKNIEKMYKNTKF